MKPQTLLMLVVALGCGLAAMVLTNSYLGSQVGDDGENELVPVVTAAVDLPGGAVISEQMVAIRKYPKEFLPENSIHDQQKVLGRAVRFHFAKGEVVTERKLAPEGVNAGIESLLEPGKRAMTVPISTEHSVAGFIKPNSHVDILMSFKGAGGKGQSMSKTVLQDVKVLAVNANMMNQAEGANKGQSVEMVTFLVTPDEAERLALAMSEGRRTMALVLRSNIDAEEVKTSGVSIDELIKGVKHEHAEDPDAVFLDSNLAEGGESTLDGIQEILSGLGKGEDEEAEEAEEVEELEPVEVVPPKKMKRLVYRDIEGTPLMEVLIPADSKIAESLTELLEDVVIDQEYGVLEQTPFEIAEGLNAPDLEMEGVMTNGEEENIDESAEQPSLLEEGN